jgi:hypothetical protein
MLKLEFRRAYELEICKAGAFYLIFQLLQDFCGAGW